MITYFKPETDKNLFFCPCGKCTSEPRLELLKALECVRRLAGIPIIVTSGPRCGDHNKAVGGKPTSEHLSGMAADIAVHNSRERFIYLDAALLAGVNRIGIGEDFLHLGISPDHDHEVAWLY